MNMFKPVKATSIAEYIGALVPERRTQIQALDAFIRKTVPTLQPHFSYNMLGYGSFPYLNSKRQQVQWPVIALASQKQYISLYVCALDGKQYLAETYKADLGNVNVGKSCIRFKKVEDVNMKTLATVLKAAAKRPGLVSAAMKKKVEAHSVSTRR